MIPAADDRGQSVVIGSILIFGIVILLLGIFQAVGIPAANEEVEFDHNLDLQSDMQSLDAALSNAVSSNSDRITKVRIGTQYPNRFIFVNPPNPTGELKTSNPSRIILANAKADGEIGDYLDGSEKRFETKSIIYRPNYHAYQNAPQTVISVGATYNQFKTSGGGGDKFVTLGGDLINGRTISFTTIDGNLSDTGLTTKIHANPISAPAQSITVTNSSPDNNVNLTIPTELPATKWEDLLADEDHVVDVIQEPGGVKIVLERNVKYNLRMGKVGIGTGANQTKAHYIVNARGGKFGIQEEGRETIVFEVRDKYNNPVSGATVNISLDPERGELVAGGETDTTINGLKTDSDGTVTVVYEAPPITSQKLDVDIQASIKTDDFNGFEPATKENSSTNLRVVNNTAVNDTSPLFNPFSGVIIKGAIIPGDPNGPCDGNTKCQVNVTFQNTGGNNATITSVRYVFFGGDAQGNSPSGENALSHILVGSDWSNSSDIRELELAGRFVSDGIDIFIEKDNGTTITKFRFYNPDDDDDGDPEPMVLTSEDWFVVDVVINGTDRRTFFVDPAE